MEHIDIKTRRTICMTGNFHQISYIDRLYLQRKNGGRALKCITTYEARILADRYHLLPQRSKNIYSLFH